MKRILFVYYSNYTSSRASSINNIQTLNSLNQLGFDSTLSTPHKLSDFKSSIEMNLPNHSSPPISFDHNYIGRLIYYTYCLWLGSRHDLIFTRDRWFLEYLRYIPKRFYPPILFEAHDCRSKLSTHSTSYSREITPEEERSQLSIADGVIALSSEIASDLQEIGIHVDQVVPLAADPSLIPEKSKAELRDEHEIEQDETVLIYAGSVNRSKNNFGLLFEAVNTLQRESNGWSLYTVGTKEDRLRPLVTEYEWLDVDLVSEKPHDEVFRYLKMADIGIVPLCPEYRKGMKYGVPMKAFEYLISGLQVVASDVPAISEYLREESALRTYEPDDVNSLIASIKDAKYYTYDVDKEKFTYIRRAEEIRNAVDNIDV